MGNTSLFTVVLAILIVLFHFESVLTFNLNVGLAKIFKGNESDVNSLFGYTVDFLLTRGATPKKWILVGAPRAFDKFQPSLVEPGALFRCSTDGNGNCEQVQFDTNGNVQDTEDAFNSQIVHYKNYGWFGASLAVGDAIMTCAPRWRDNIETIRNQGPLTHMTGICYEIPRVMDPSSVGKFAFFSEANKDNWTEPFPPDFHETGTYYNFMYGQMGMSVRYMNEDSNRMVIGAPGMGDGNGGAIVYQSVVEIGREPFTEDRKHDYFGYAVMPGKFLGDGQVYIAMGGPRENGTGAVKILGRFSNGGYEVKAVIVGEETGSYFGSVLCAVDVGDSDVLVVGAPFFGNLTVVNFDTNHINQDEGKVYVYTQDGHMGLKNVQTLRGSMSRNARFGSALTTPGDLNNDGANDLVVGAPYEDEGRGAIYIFNGYRGQFWERPTQIIKASTIDTNLKGFGLYLSQFKLDEDDNLYNDLAIGAPWSNRVVMIKSNPTISMEVSLKTSLDNPVNIIQSDTRNFNIQVCFKYEGDRSSPPDVTVNFTVNIDYNRTMVDKRERVVAVGGGNSVSGDKKVIKGYKDPQCSGDFTMVVQSHRQDIVSPVTFLVKYGIVHQSGTGMDCTMNPCPIISLFDAKRQVPDTDFFQDMIEFKKPGCGLDNRCDTDLVLTAVPTFNHNKDALIRGPKAGFSIQVTVENLREPAYAVDFRVFGPSFISYWKVIGEGNSEVTCSPRNTAEGVESFLECGLSNSEIPLGAGVTTRFTIYFVAPDAPPDDSFTVKMTLTTRSNDVDPSNNEVSFTRPINSMADIVFSGVGSPELFVTSKTKTDSVYHLFDFNNKGPSELDQPTTLTVKYPRVTIDSKEILQVTNLTVTVPLDIREFTCGDDYIVTSDALPMSSTGPISKDSKVTYLIREKNPTNEDRLLYNCESAPCKTLSCSVSPLGVNAIMTVRFTYRMDPDILAKVKRQDAAVESLSISSVATINLPNSIRLETDLFHSATAKTDVVPAEQKEERVAWWVVLLGVLGALLVLAIIILIFYKLGFFKRADKEQLDKLQKESKYEEKPDDGKKLINNGKEKESAKEEDDDATKKDVSQGFDELEKMLQEVQDYS